MAKNEPNKEPMHPEAQNFVNDFYRLNDEYNKLKKTVVDQSDHIITLSGDIEQYKLLVADLSRERDYYMRLCTEQQTHFRNIQALTIEADKCFRTAPYRANGAPPTEQQQQIEHVKDKLPEFLNKGPAVQEEWK